MILRKSIANAVPSLRVLLLEVQSRHSLLRSPVHDGGMLFALRLPSGKSVEANP